MTVMIRRILFALAALLAGVTAAAAQSNYEIRPGDTLQVEVLEDSSLNRSTLVLPDGRISFPLAGTLQAGGLTVGQVQTELAARLKSNFASTPTVFVSVSRLAEAQPPAATALAPTIEVYVLGEAANPGKYEVAPGTTLLQLFAQIGGFSNFAATKRVQLRRVDKSGTERVYIFNYKAMEAGKIAGGTTVVGNGDVIVVPQRHLFE